MTAISKPQRVYLPGLHYFHWNQQPSILEWSADDIVTLEELSQPFDLSKKLVGRQIFSMPAREILRATLTIGYLRLYLADGRMIWLALLAADPVLEDGSVTSLPKADRPDGVADPLWWKEQLEAAGVPVKHRTEKWASSVFLGGVAAIAAVVAAIVIVVL